MCIRDRKETYDVGHLAPEQTDFGVRISGDSMEPLYHTGDVAWIQKKDSLANGEIGIFYLNGNTYIKELHLSLIHISLVLPFHQHW